MEFGNGMETLGLLRLPSPGALVDFDLINCDQEYVKGRMRQKSGKGQTICCVYQRGSMSFDLYNTNMGL